MQRALQQLFFDNLKMLLLHLDRGTSWIVGRNHSRPVGEFVAFPRSTLRASVASFFFFREISTECCQTIENERLICPKACPKPCVVLKKVYSLWGLVLL